MSQKSMSYETKVHELVALLFKHTFASSWVWYTFKLESTSIYNYAVKKLILFAEM